MKLRTCDSFLDDTIISYHDYFNVYFLFSILDNKMERDTEMSSVSPSPYLIPSLVLPSVSFPIPGQR